MFRFILNRLAVLIPTFIGASIVAFAFIRVLPGDPVMLMSGERVMSQERYEEITRRAVELSSSEEVDLEPVIALLRDLIGLTRTMATLDSCEAVQIGVTTFNPHAAYARWVLRTALAQFAELVQNFDTQTIVTVMTLGFEASGLQAELCGGVYEDNNGTLALVDTELAGRLQQSVVTNDTLEFQRIAAAAYQLQLPQTLALLEQMAPL